jgi:hypothetical protein
MKVPLIIAELLLWHIKFFNLKLTQNPFDPVDSNIGLIIIALTVFAASTTFGNCDVSKKA